MSKPARPIPHESTAPPSGEPEDIHRLLVERVSDYAIFALDPAGNVLTWNVGAERMNGYRPDEIQGRHFSVFYPPEDIAAGKPENELRTATELGRVEDEGWRLRTDGTRFWARVTITALRDNDGTLRGFGKVTRDLTARRAEEERLRASEERMRLLIESVRDYAIFMLDPDGRVTTWNEGAQRIKGYTAAEIIGHHFSEFYPPEDAAKPAMELAVARRDGRYEEEGWRVRKDGSRFWASVVITAVRAPDGALAGYAKVTRDLTVRRAADELEQRARVAEAANRVKAEFLAAMSHELRTPLNAIGGYAQLLQMGLSGPVTASQQKQLDRIILSQHHLLALINDILNFSRIEAGQVSFALLPFAVGDAMAAIVPMIEPQATAQGVTLDVGSCAPDLMAMGDRAKVEQVLINLLSNALKFTARGGAIDVACSAAEGTVRLAVRDTGVGIPTDALERIFEPFVQVNRTLAAPKEGTGLGLAISRDLARAMHGDITVTSRERLGSTFTLSLPLAPDQAEPAPTANAGDTKADEAASRTR